MKEQKNESRVHLRNDVLFIAILLVICAAGIVYLFVFREGGNTVKVTVDGELYGTYLLSKDVSEDIITGEKGENLNKLVISDGKAYIEKASCPDGICASHRPVFRDGESIVCLPNKVVVTVFTETDTDGPDIVA